MGNILMLLAGVAGAIIFVGGPLQVPILEAKPVPVPVLFVGDIMMDRTVRTYTRAQGDDLPFSCMAPLLKSMPLVVGNLEGTVTTHPSKSEASTVGEPANTTFTFPTTTVAALMRNNISVVNLGNNHILDFGIDGLSETKAWLFAGGVEYFGDPAVSAPEAVVRKEVGGVKLSFINWNEWYGANVSDVVDQIGIEKVNGRVVVYTHWGDEYVKPPKRVKNWAHQFVDAGADIIIGTHPHVVLEHELYNGKNIYYSLGNFVFDQYWNSAVSTGLTLKVYFTKDGVDHVEEIPVKLNRDRTTCVIE